MKHAGGYHGLAIIAGASEGIGAAFARRFAADGHDLLLVARRPAPLADLADELRERHGVAVEVLACDLGDDDAVDRVARAVGTREVGLLVCNAAHVPMGPFARTDPRSLRMLLQVNAVSPTLLVRRFIDPDSPRRQGVILLSSMAGWQGAPMLAGYAATKAYLRVLGEALWDELRGTGVDVLVSVPGATSTPGYRAQMGGGSFGVLSPERVVAASMRALGRRPFTVPGLLYKLSSFAMNRLVPRRAAIVIMGIAGRRIGSGS